MERRLVIATATFTFVLAGLDFGIYILDPAENLDYLISGILFFVCTVGLLWWSWRDRL